MNSLLVMLIHFSLQVVYRVDQEDVTMTDLRINQYANFKLVFNLQKVNPNLVNLYPIPVTTGTLYFQGVFPCTSAGISSWKMNGLNSGLQTKATQVNLSAQITSVTTITLELISQDTCTIITDMNIQPKITGFLTVGGDTYKFSFNLIFINMPGSFGSSFSLSKPNAFTPACLIFTL